MRKPEPIPPEILSDAADEVIGLWMTLRTSLTRLHAAGDDPHRLDLLAATLTSAVIARVNGLYPMREVHLSHDPAASLKMPDWEKIKP